MSTPATRTVPECGTYAAVQRHQRLDEPMDDACRKARAEYMRGLRQRSPQVREAEQRYRRAAYRATQRLKAEQRARFAALLDEELRRGGGVVQ